MGFISIQAESLSPLAANKAFSVSVSVRDNQTLTVRFDIAKGYYLYKTHLAFASVSQKTALGLPILPANAKIKVVPGLGRYLVYEGLLTVPVPVLPPSPATLRLKVSYQGCSEAGFCYPPTDQLFLVDFSKGTVTALSGKAPSNNIILWCLSFLGFGLLISFTPCVLPMIPILSGMILRQAHPNKKAFLLAVFYVIGMAFTYAMAGLLFGLMGNSLQMIFQQTWVMVIFALFFIVLALSLWGFYDLQWPLSWRSFFERHRVNKENQGYFSIFLMGCLSVLVLSPCVTPPLVAALTYISQTGNAAIGGIALFFMGLGMGIPLLIVGGLGAKYLPKAGPWMQILKKIMALMLVGVAISLLIRVWPIEKAQKNALFIPVQSLSELKHIINQPENQHKRILLDFYASWCVACHVMDRFTFQNTVVQQNLKNWLLLRVDVTDQSLAEKALMQHFGIIAPPSLVIFDLDKNQTPQVIIGETSAKALNTRIQQLAH